MHSREGREQFPAETGQLFIARRMPVGSAGYYAMTTYGAINRIRLKHEILVIADRLKRFIGVRSCRVRGNAEVAIGTPNRTGCPVNIVTSGTRCPSNVIPSIIPDTLHHGISRGHMIIVKRSIRIAPDSVAVTPWVTGNVPVSEQRLDRSIIWCGRPPDIIVPSYLITQYDFFGYCIIVIMAVEA